MSSYERRLIRKQINLKLYCMSNKEAQEKDFLNSSQMITERQHMYMVIEKHFREKENLRTSKKQLPFNIENTSLPHVNIGRMSRLLNITEKITENSKEMDKVIKVHSYRTATPYYTNPELTLERGNFMNYSQHVGALLHTPRYVKFLERLLKGNDHSSDHQASEKNSHLSSNSNSSRFFTESESSNKSRSNSHSSENATSRKTSTSLSLSSSKSKFSNDKSVSSESSLIKSPSNKTSTSTKITDKQHDLNESENESFKNNYDDKFESRNSSETTMRKDSAIINIENEELKSSYFINEKEHSGKSSKLSGYSFKVERNENMVNSDINKISSPKGFHEDISNSSIGLNEDQNFSNTLLEKNGDNNYDDSFDNISHKSKDELNRSMSSQSNKNDILNIRINSNMNENQENKINETADIPDAAKKESDIIFENENKIFSNTNFFKEVEEYFNNNKIEQDDFQPMKTYFETAVHFGNTKPDYVSDFYKFLAKQNKINFINFTSICNKYAIGNFTNEEVNKVKKLFNKFSKTSKVDKDTNNEKQGIIDNSLEIKHKSKNENLHNEANNENLTNEVLVDETKLTESKSPEIEKILNNNLEIDKNNLNDEHFDENEDFSESFSRLFRVSIPEISKNDLFAIKQLVTEYKDNKRPNTNTNLRKNSYKSDENDNSDSSESFHNLVRDSIGDITNGNIMFLPNVVGNTEEIDQELNSRENNDNNTNNFRSSIGEISQSDLDNIRNATVNHHHSFNESENGKNQSSLQEDDFNEDDDIDLENRILMSFRSLFRNSIDTINERDLEKINDLLENHEKEFFGN